MCRVCASLAADFLSEIADRAFNHDHVGLTALQPPLHPPSSAMATPKGYRINARRQLLGTGIKVRKRGRQWCRRYTSYEYPRLPLCGVRRLEAGSRGVNALRVRCADRGIVYSPGARGKRCAGAKKTALRTMLVL